ncbi:MAG: hypothetical protein AAFP99_11685, partial [Pseudomonadota bacterium]
MAIAVFDQKHAGPNESRLRLATLTNTRWLAILGQGIAISIVGGYLQFTFPVAGCILLLFLSAVLNLVLIWLYPATERMSPPSVFSVLVFDVVQLSAMLYLTGGLENPFAVLMIVHVVISAATLTVPYTIVVGGLVAFLSTMLAFVHMPLPWFP